MIPRSGEAGEAVRCISVHLTVDGKEYCFRRLDGDQVHCLALNYDEVFEEPCILGIYDVWRGKPTITEYWGLVDFRFDDWSSFAREQRWRILRLRFRLWQIWRKLSLRVESARKEVSVERYSILNAVRVLKTSERLPDSWDVAREVLGERWIDKNNAMARIDQVEDMLEALVDLQELRKEGRRYAVTGKGVAALSQYEEEERKHRESMGLQKGIRWLTLIMAAAALLQAKVVEFTPLLKWTGTWPWQ